jgi:methyl-accepting chemotaxis protein
MEDISSMTSQISTASREQSDSTRATVRSVGTITEMTQQMVKATGRQSSDSTNIKNSVEQASLMTLTLFDSMESRRLESQRVVAELEALSVRGE